MVLINCPNCGPRNAQEFRYGGEVRPRPPDPSALDEQAWSDYVFMKANAHGLQREWWYHRAGCQQWFQVERNTRTNEIAEIRRHE